MYETAELAIEALADYNSDAYSVFGPCRFELDNTRENAIRDVEEYTGMDFVINADMDLQLAAYIYMKFRYDDWYVPPEALLLYHKYDDVNDTYEAPVVLARYGNIETVSDPKNEKEATYYVLSSTLKYTGQFWRGDRIQAVYAWASKYSGRSRYATCNLEVRSCTEVEVPPTPRPM